MQMIKYELSKFNRLERQEFNKNPCLDFEETDYEGNPTTELKFVSDDPADPITCNVEETKWYFWDETWANLVGPYSCEDEARSKLDEYVRIALDGENA